MLYEIESILMVAARVIWRVIMVSELFQALFCIRIHLLFFIVFADDDRKM